MGLLGNYSVILKSCGNYIAGATIADNRANYNTTGRNRRYHYGAFDQRSAVPVGYSNQNSWVLPIKEGDLASRIIGVNNFQNPNLAGGININTSISGSGDISTANLNSLAFLIASLTNSSTFTVDAVGSVNIASNLAGSGDLNGSLGALVTILADLNGSGDLSAEIAGAVSIISNLTGSGNLDGAIKATVSLISTIVGTSDLQSTIIGNWDMICSILGNNNLISSIDAKAYMNSNILSANSLTLNNGAVAGFMTSDITSLSELSPESLASSLWNSVASQYNLAGTMGAKLNAAGNAANPWDEVISGGYTAREVMELLLEIALQEGGVSSLTLQQIEQSLILAKENTVIGLY